MGCEKAPVPDMTGNIDNVVPKCWMAVNTLQFQSDNEWTTNETM